MVPYERRMLLHFNISAHYRKSFPIVQLDTFANGKIEVARFLCNQYRAFRLSSGAQIKALDSTFRKCKHRK